MTNEDILVYAFGVVMEAKDWEDATVCVRTKKLLETYNAIKKATR